MRKAVLVVAVLLVAWRVYAQCCGSWPAVRGAPSSDTPTPIVTPAATATTTNTPTDGCAFHQICDNSALTVSNDASNGSTYAWVNPALAKTIDTANAGGTNLLENQTSQYLKVLDFAGSTANPSIASCVTGAPGVNTLPDDAVIQGFKIQINGCKVSSIFPPDIIDIEMKLVVGGVFGTTNQALSGGWLGTYNCFHGSPSRFYGSASDLWGFGSVSGAQVKALDFGVALSVKATGGPASPSVDGFAFTQICYKLAGE